jgi:hypothetical protein
MGIRIGPPPPLDVRTVPGLRGWYREDVSLSGGNVTNWLDKSGLGLNLDVGGGTNPTIVTSDTTIRGKQALDFTSSQSLITTVNSSNWFTGNYTVFIVNRYDSSNCGHPTTSGRLLTAHGGNWYVPSRSCSPDTWVIHNGIFDVAVLVPPVGAWCIQSHRWNGTTLENRQSKNGGVALSGAIAAYTANTSTVTVGGTGWDGRMAEIIVFNTYLDDVWMSQIYAYLKSRYGL